MAEDYDIGKAFEAIEDELIASMIRNMKRHRAEETEQGMEWSQWQAEQLKALEQYKKRNAEKYRAQFREINTKVEALLRLAKQEGGMSQEIEILKAIKEGFSGYQKAAKGLTGEFFRLNERKLEALIKATTDDMKKAETAVLRMANDQYRKAVFNAQVYANTGAGTYEKAVDMATKDMLAAGLNCVQYVNGARHTLSDYADMALKTASKRAYLQGEGEKRQEWGVTTVIMNKRGNPCPKCLPFCGKVLIDDVWSGGKKEDGPYPLMSKAIERGLYHPRCKDSHTTYFPGISTADDTWTQEELDAIGQANKQEAEQQYAERQAKKQERLAKYSLDAENQKVHEVRQKKWEERASLLDIKEKITTGRKYEPEMIPERKNGVAKAFGSGIMDLTDDEIYALNRYLGFESYGINEKLRKGTRLNAMEQKMVDSLDSALKKMPRYEGDLSRSLYFGDEQAVADCLKSFKVGKEVSFDEFVSTTSGKELYNPDGEIQLIIKNSLRGRDLTLMNKQEAEVLYERGSRFKVICKYVHADKKFIFLEELNE